MRSIHHLTTLLAVAGLAMFTIGCGDEAPTVHTPEELLDALLTVDDVAFIPADWQENTREVVEAPEAPFDGTLDPYLCSEAGIPAALTLPQAQVELTGADLMEILLGSKDAASLYEELDAAYQACGAGTSLVYEPLEGVPSVGDESASYVSDLGFVTIARVGTDLMVLKWLIQGDVDEGMPYYPQLVTTAADKVTALSG